MNTQKATIQYLNKKGVLTEVRFSKWGEGTHVSKLKGPTEVYVRSDDGVFCATLDPRQYRGMSNKPSDWFEAVQARPREEVYTTAMAGLSCEGHTPREYNNMLSVALKCHPANKDTWGGTPMLTFEGVKRVLQEIEFPDGTTGKSILEVVPTAQRLIEESFVARIWLTQAFQQSEVVLLKANLPKKYASIVELVAVGASSLEQRRAIARREDLGVMFVEMLAADKDYETCCAVAGNTKTPRSGLAWMFQVAPGCSERFWVGS